MSRPCLQLRAINDRRAYRSINMQSSWFAAPRSSDFTGGFDDCSSRHLGRGASPSGQDSERCRDLVGQAESIALADLNEPLHISALCGTLAVSERTLRKAFHTSRGLPPCRCLRMLRLAQARRALLSADGRRATATEIAVTLGFVELGRFSVEYRKTCGESPSKTLHHV